MASKTSNPLRALSPKALVEAIVAANNQALTEAIAAAASSALVHEEDGTVWVDNEAMKDKALRDVAASVMEGLTEVVWSELGEGRKVRLPFVAMNVRYKPAREAGTRKDPRTGEMVKVKAAPSALRITATPEKQLKTAGVPTTRSEAGKTIEKVALKRREASAKRARARAREEAAAAKAPAKRGAAKRGAAKRGAAKRTSSRR